MFKFGHRASSHQSTQFPQTNQNMPATSVRSASSGHGGARVKPHILGGSNNLMSERQRREKAETALLKTKESLQTVKMELAPQLEQLFEAIKVCAIDATSDSGHKD